MPVPIVTLGVPERQGIVSLLNPGRYALKATNEYNCSATETVEINSGCYLEIPNVFTPNGDGINDYFFLKNVYSRNFSDFKMQIYNRWGQKIFESSLKSGLGWDGKFNGRLQPEGTYIYFIEIERDGNTREQYQGNLTLVR